jgi:hypothetical protein
MGHQGPIRGDSDLHKIRILLVDQQTLMRAGLRLLLESAPDMQVVGEAQDARIALAKPRTPALMWPSWNSACRRWAVLRL